MNIKKYFWDLNESALEETERILGNPNHPRFTARMVTLLSRCDKPRELFSLLTRKDFYGGHGLRSEATGSNKRGALISETGGRQFMNKS